jgi:hypothetical protein
LKDQADATGDFVVGGTRGKDRAALGALLVVGAPGSSVRLVGSGFDDRSLTRG